MASSDGADVEDASGGLLHRPLKRKARDAAEWLVRPAKWFRRALQSLAAPRKLLRSSPETPELCGLDESQCQAPVVQLQSTTCRPSSDAPAGEGSATVPICSVKTARRLYFQRQLPSSHKPQWKPHHLYLAKKVQNLPRVPAAALGSNVSLLPLRTSDAAHDVPGRLTICIDLDQTLITCIPPDPRHQASENLVPMSGHGLNFEVLIRPGAREFLQALATCPGSPELVLFTAGEQRYAEMKLQALGPVEKVFSHRLFRNSCARSGKLFIKDLSVLGRPLDRVLLVDDCPFCYAFQPDNGVNISAWEGKEDEELLSLLPLLTFLARQLELDVRPSLRSAFQAAAAIADFKLTASQAEMWQREGFPRL